jgi:hypothetical protein
VETLQSLSSFPTWHAANPAQTEGPETGHVVGMSFRDGIFIRVRKGIAIERQIRLNEITIT